MIRSSVERILWLRFVAVAVTFSAGVLAAQVGSPTGQPNGPGQKSTSPPSAQSPRLSTSPPVNAPRTPDPFAVPVETEIGELDGASFRIDVPENWNRGVVMYYHGYDSDAIVFKPHPPFRILQQILNRGYAVAQSGYSQGGWAVEQAATETEALRRYFEKKHSPVRETFVMGHSMGGLLTAMTLEQNPAHYQGGLALCGVLAPADLAVQRAFANRVAFDAFFPGTLPDVENIPDDFKMTNLAAVAAVEQALNSKPDDAELMRSLADIHTNRGLADVLVFNTFLIKDLQIKAAGNPFDNRNLIYTGTTNDAALNAKVKRYAADPKAWNYLSSYYTPTGDMRRKLLAVHTIYDPLVPAATSAYYDSATRRHGDGELFVQQYVNRDGHCNVTAEETGLAFDELLGWAHDGRRPRPGLLPEPAPRPTPPSQQKQPPPKNVGKPQ